MSIRDCDRCTAITAAGHRCKLITCKTGPYCYVHSKSILGVRVKRSGVHGQGLFAERKFRRGENIAEYTGPLTVEIPEGDYGLEMRSGRFRDAIRTNSTVARYANDCRGTGRRCNAALKGDRHDPDRAWLRAQHKIRKGQEIMAKYGDQYWR